MTVEQWIESLWCTEEKKGWGGLNEKEQNEFKRGYAAGICAFFNTVEDHPMHFTGRGTLELHRLRCPPVLAI